MSEGINWKRPLRMGGIVILLSAITLFVIGLVSAWQYSSWVLHPGCRGSHDSLAALGFESDPVSFPSRSGPVLRGWYARGTAHPEIAIIVLTGHGGNTYHTIPDAHLFARSGYSTLIYEHRSCADPSLAATTGLREADDLLGAVDYLKTRPDVSHIGVMGFSEGGTASLLAAPREPAIDAVLAAGGYDSLRNDILDADHDLNPLDRVGRVLVTWTMGIQLGVPVEASSPVDTIAQISPRPLFLIYGEYESAAGQALYEAASEPKQIWIVPGTGHGGYQKVAPEEYPRRVVEFFNQVFLKAP